MLPLAIYQSTVTAGYFYYSEAINIGLSSTIQNRQVSPQTVVRKKCPVENVRLPFGVRLRQVEMIGAWVTWCTNSLPPCAGLW